MRARRALGVVVGWFDDWVEEVRDMREMGEPIPAVLIILIGLLLTAAGIGVAVTALAAFTMLWLGSPGTAAVVTLAGSGVLGFGWFVWWLAEPSEDRQRVE